MGQYKGYILIMLNAVLGVLLLVFSSISAYTQEITGAFGIKFGQRFSL